MTKPTALETTVYPAPAAGVDALSPVQLTRLTFKFDCLRAIPAGMLESAGSTFLLLIAVQAYQPVQRRKR